jgi:intermediate peptidase
MEAHESWAQLPGRNDASGDNLLIQKYLVRDASSGALIGTVLMDLFERDNKFPGSAHFTVQCGCTRTHITTTNRDGVTTLSESAQLPIVALVFHFKAPRSTASTTSVTQHALLSLQDVETLHHEWGHALHSLLSQTRFQHLSGTRGGTDFVEVSGHSLVRYVSPCSYLARTAWPMSLLLPC